MDKMRGVSVEQAALAQGFQNQGNIALLEIADTAVDELRYCGSRCLWRSRALQEGRCAGLAWRHPRPRQDRSPRRLR